MSGAGGYRPPNQSDNDKLPTTITDEQINYNSTAESLIQQQSAKLAAYYKTTDPAAIHAMEHKHVDVGVNDLDKEDRMLLMSSDDDEHGTPVKKSTTKRLPAKPAALTDTHTARIEMCIDDMMTNRSLTDYQALVLKYIVRHQRTAYQSHLTSIATHIQQTTTTTTGTPAITSAVLIQMCTNLFKLYVADQFNKLFENMSTDDAKSISQSDRHILRTKGTSLVYGEISIDSLYSILYDRDTALGKWLCDLSVDRLKDIKFVDLGSGTGRGVFGAAMLTQFGTIDGVEVLSGLYNASYQIQQQYNQYIEKQYTQHAGDDDACKQLSALHQQRHIELIHSDMLQYDWSHYDFVLCNSTCYDARLMMAIQTGFEKCKSGAWLITFTKSVHNSTTIELVSQTRHKQSWGQCTVFVHRRV